MADYRVLHGLVERVHPKGEPFTQEFRQGDVIDEDMQKELGLDKRELERLEGHGAIEKIEEYKPKKSKSKSKATTAEEDLPTEEDLEESSEEEEEVVEE